jgi:hypothetical protein
MSFAAVGVLLMLVVLGLIGVLRPDACNRLIHRIDEINKMPRQTFLDTGLGKVWPRVIGAMFLLAALNVVIIELVRAA